MTIKINPLFNYALVLSFLTFNLCAQKNDVDSLTHFTSFSFHYAYQIPMADMAKRFVPNSNVGATIDFVTKNKWIFSAEYGFMFGDSVKENNVIDNLKGSTGFILDGNGDLARVFLWERGIYASLKIGKTLSLQKKKLTHSGLCLQFGAGFLQHKILIYNTEYQIPSLAGDYKKGYDRLSNGLALQQSICYRLYHDQRPLGYFIGLESTQGFTKNRRDYNFDTMQKDNSQRLDVLLSAKAGISIILGRKKRAGYYMY